MQIRTAAMHAFAESGAARLYRGEQLASTAEVPMLSRRRVRELGRSWVSFVCDCSPTRRRQSRADAPAPFNHIHRLRSAGLRSISRKIASP